MHCTTLSQCGLFLLSDPRTNLINLRINNKILSWFLPIIGIIADAITFRRTKSHVQFWRTFCESNPEICEPHSETIFEVMEDLAKRENVVSTLSTNEYHNLIREAYLISNFGPTIDSMISFRGTKSRWGCVKNACLTEEGSYDAPVWSRSEVRGLIDRPPLPEKLCELMENILLHEQELVTVFSWKVSVLVSRIYKKV